MALRKTGTWIPREVSNPMKKLLCLLFAAAIVFSLATRVLAQPDNTVKGQVTEERTKKKKHHKKKHKIIPVVENIGSQRGGNPANVRSNA